MGWNGMMELTSDPEQQIEGYHKGGPWVNWSLLIPHSCSLGKSLGLKLEDIIWKYT